MPQQIALGTFGQDTANKALLGPPVPITANGALNPHLAARYVIRKAGVAAMTLGAPTPGVDDGTYILILSETANQHTLTATGLFVDGAGHVNVATFPAFAGGSIELMADQGKWYVLANVNVTLS